MVLKLDMEALISTRLLAPVLTQGELVGLCSSEIPRPVKSKGTNKSTHRRRNRALLKAILSKSIILTDFKLEQMSK